MSECIYKEMTPAKNGTLIPVFQNGRTFFSSYNPERDAENFCTAHNDAFSKAGCILVGGIGNGLHLKLLSEKYPESLIIAFEADEEALTFSVSHLSCTLPDSVLLTESSQLTSLLPMNYIPAMHGNFAFAAIRSWSDFLGNRMSGFISLINRSISDISADYSVQAQFGKLWHKNILVNLSLFDNMKREQLFSAKSFSVSGRKAAIIGAGPSLDKSLTTLLKKRNEYCIFATDTSFNPLISAGITPDFVVTVDSQQISEKHFVGQDLSKTILATDLTGNSSIIRSAINQGARVLFFHNNHPLSVLIDDWLHHEKNLQSPFPFIDSGAGTVLHAAADLSRKSGFTELEFFGADFSYADGKPYTKGTYLEKQFYSDNLRISTSETAYSKIMYRTPLIPVSDKIFTTEVLSRYKNALDAYMKSTCSLLDFSENKPSVPLFSDFLSWYLENLHLNNKKVYFSLLPLVAWYKFFFPNADTETVYAFAEQFSADVGRIQCRLQKK